MLWVLMGFNGDTVDASPARRKPDRPWRIVVGVVAILAAFGLSLGVTGISQAQQPRLVADINPTENTEYGSTRDLTSVGGLVCFSGDDGFHGNELWCSDGSEAGTEMVKDIQPGSGSSEPRWLADVGGTLFFVADDGEHGGELWRSDGTEAGTEMVRDIYPGNSPDFFGIYAPASLTNVDGTLFFTADDGQHGGELWRSDGTEAGTELVKDIYPWETNPWGTRSYVTALTKVGDLLFFNAEDGEHGRELWRSDGTEAGTEMVKDIYPGESSRYAGPAGSDPHQLITVGNAVFFGADDGAHGTELWRSDGTEAGTEMVRDVAPGPESSGAAEFTDIGGTVMFRVGYEAARVFELWRSDGTEAGTEIVTAPGWVTLSRLTSVNGTLFFTAASSGYGGGLWRSDGTDEGTVLVRGIFPGIWPAGESFTSIGGTLFFMAYDEHGGELWRSDGTQAGTEMVGEIYPGGASYPFPGYLTPVGKTLFFVADDDVHGYDALWALDTDDPPTAVDEPPSAIDDEATLMENSPATSIDVLVNDTDSDGGSKSIDSATQPAQGAVEIADEGAGLSYEPDADYCNDPPGEETDDFEYTLAPGGSSAKVAVTVTCVDDDDPPPPPDPLPPPLQDGDSGTVAPSFAPPPSAAPPASPAPPSAEGVSPEEPGQATPVLLDWRVRITRQRAAVTLRCAQRASCRGRLWIFPRRSVAQTSRLRAAVVQGRYAIPGRSARVVWMRLTAAGRQMSRYGRLVGGRLLIAGQDHHGRQLASVMLQFARPRQ